MKRKLFALITVTAVVASLLAGCSGNQTSSTTAAPAASAETTKAETGTTAAAAASEAATEASSDEPITIRTCFTTGMTGAVNNFAIEKGLYKELGIEFDNYQADGIQGRLSLMSRGDIDIADGDPSSYIPAINNGVPAKLVGNMWRYSGCYWLVANNDIQSFEDLKGKTIGTSGASGGMKLSVLKMLEANGISEDEVTLVANGSYQKAYATLTSGEVDATIIHNPYASLAVAEGIGHPMGRAWDYIPDYYTGTIMASNDFIENHPDELQRFITAYYKVHEEVKNEYFDEFITWAAANMNTTEEVMRDAVESEIDVWLDYPVIPEERLKTTFEYLKQYGWVEDGVTPDGTYTNEFALRAAEELGMTDPEAK
jgi:NitT/TauT family transport system substrate-binding protein